MRTSIIGMTAASLLVLTACGGKGDDKLGDQAQEQMENQADVLDAAADNASGTTEDLLEANADATREAGAAKEEAIDEADVNADGMSDAQKNDVINAM